MSLFDKLNLRPNERRILVVVGFLIFVVLNWTFVRPLFGQWDKAQKDLEAARETQKKYQAEIAKAPSYKAMEEELRNEGNEVLSEQLQLQRIVVEQYAAAAGIIPTIRPTPLNASSNTNQFFENQVLVVDFTAFSTNFVEWLVGLATGNNMIRVEDMTLKTDAPGQKLSGSIEFVASYKKKAGARGTAAMGAISPSATSANAGGRTPPAGWAAPSSGSSTNRPATNSPAIKPSTTKPSTNATKPPKK